MGEKESGGVRNKLRIPIIRRRNATLKVITVEVNEARHYKTKRGILFT